ncbi:YybS family protein [Bacillaceae bacterium W0354]
MNQSKAITEGAIFTGVYVALLLMTLFVPFISIFSIFLLPIPFVLYSYRYGIKNSGVMFIAALLVSMIVATIFSLPTTVLMGLGGIAIGWALYEGKETYETWARGALGFSLGLGFVYAITQFVFDVNWNEQFSTMIDESLESTVNFFSQFGQGLDDKQVELLNEQFHHLLYLIPTGIVLFGTLLAFLALWISYKLINRLENKNYKFPKFREFQLPTSLIWYFFAGIILSWIFTDPNETMYLVATNIYTLTGMLLVLQGLSFVFFYTHYKNWSKAIPIVLIVIFVLYPLLLLYPIRFLGIIDLGFQMRDRLTKS